MKNDLAVILLQDVRHLGRQGEVVKVKSGFARNYLLPMGSALEATRANRSYFEQQRKKIDALHNKERNEALGIAEGIAGSSLKIAKRIGEKGTLLGSVTTAEIAKELKRKGVTIDKRRIDLGGVTRLETLGDHKVTIDLHPEVMAELVVSIVAERSEEKRRSSPGQRNAYKRPQESHVAGAEECRDIESRDFQRVLARLSTARAELRAGYPDLTHRELSWRHFRKLAIGELWDAVENLESGGYHRQLADILDAAVSRLEAFQLDDRHLSAIDSTLSRLAASTITEADIDACENEWRVAEVDTLPSLRDAFEGWLAASFSSQIDGG